MASVLRWRPGLRPSRAAGRLFPGFVWKPGKTGVDPVYPVDPVYLPQGIWRIWLFTKESDRIYMIDGMILLLCPSRKEGQRRHAARSGRLALQSIGG